MTWGPPTAKGFLHFAAGELAGCEGQWDRAAARHRAARSVAASTEAAFLDGITAVGSVSALSALGPDQSALDHHGGVPTREEALELARGAIGAALADAP